MHPLSADQIIRAWEMGQRLHLVDRALTFLALSHPDQSVDNLARLTIGQRDALLLTLREMTFGNTLNCFAQCPECGEALEFTLETAQIRVTNPNQTLESEYAFAIAEFEGKFRLANSFDLAAIAGYRNPEVAKSTLLKRCLLQANHNGIAVSHQDLPMQVITHIATQMVEIEHEWQILFDIVSFLWTELSAQAKRLLLEVHELARHYSWHETDILAMSPMRRNLYLELIG
jgi:hypothetical protein